MPRRFVELRSSDAWLVLDCKNPNNPIVVCKCEGFNGPLNAEYIVAALEAYHSRLISTLGMDTPDDPNAASGQRRG